MTKPRNNSTIDLPSKQDLDHHLGLPYQIDFHDPDVQHRINHLTKFFDQYGIPSSLDFSKRQAYPNQDYFGSIPCAHDTNKWLEAIKQIYFQEKNGSNRAEAIQNATAGWEPNEAFDFLNWLKYYETGDHMKYKTAQMWYESPSIPGYMLKIKPNAPEPKSGPSDADIDFAREEAEKNQERRQTIEKQRNKIIGRLDSAEKLLRSPDGHLFSGKEFEVLLEALYQLKKKIQMVNKVSSSIRLYEDMIIREANILHRNGFNKAAETLYKLSDPVTAPTPPSSPDSPAPPMPTDPNTPIAGAPTPPAPEPPKEDQPPGIKEFLEAMNTGNFTDENQADILEVEDGLEVFDQPITIEAQATPPETEDIPMTSSPAPAPLNPSPVEAPTAPTEHKEKLPPIEPLEVSEKDLKAPVDETIKSNFDQKIDDFLSNVTVEEVVAKLEDLANFYKTREAPRQLGLVDMMLDSLGLASYFPSLAEATNKSLESNNYISTRIEDILSKLRGAITDSSIEIKPQPQAENPEVASIKQKLQSDADKEKVRKELRKEQEATQTGNPIKETPNVEINEDLATQPVPQPNPRPRTPAPVV